MKHSGEEVQSDKGHSSPLNILIVVNGAEEIWQKPKINYEQIVRIAFPDGPWGGNICYNVTWTKLDGQEGSLRPGSKPVDVAEGMMIDVRNTDKS
jgi:hypothetical protein